VQLKEESSPHEQDPPAQTTLATQGVRRRRVTITGPTVGMLLSGAAAVPVAGAIGWRPTWVTALLVVFAVSAVWFAAGAAARRRGESDGDRDRIRGEASLRIHLAEVSIKLDSIIARMDGRSEFAAGYITGTKRRLAGAGSKAPSGRADSRGPDAY
jgi:hypothetical protein